MFIATETQNVILTHFKARKCCKFWAAGLVGYCPSFLKKYRIPFSWHATNRACQQHHLVAAVWQQDGGHR